MYVNAAPVVTSRPTPELPLMTLPAAERRSQSGDADVVDLHGGVVTVPRGQPLVTPLPEFLGRVRGRVGPGLGAVAVGAVVRNVAARAADGHVELEVEL